MDSYIDIRVLPDLELSESALLNNLFAKLHRQLGTGDIGVSFPNVSSRLGDTLRIHGNAVRLEQLMQQPWLKGLRDYTETSAVLPVPTEIKATAALFAYSVNPPVIEKNAPLPKVGSHKKKLKSVTQILNPSANRF